MSHYHAVVWIDHQRATVWQFASTEQSNTVIHAHDQHQRVHSRKSTHGGHKSAADHHFFDEVAHALEGVHENYPERSPQSALAVALNASVSKFEDVVRAVPATPKYLPRRAAGKPTAPKRYR
jgi:hypothetical protein